MYWHLPVQGKDNRPALHPLHGKIVRRAGQGPSPGASRPASDQQGRTCTYEKWGRPYAVEVYLLCVDEVLDEWDERYRVREWVSVAEAADRVGEARLKEMLARVPALVRP